MKLGDLDAQFLRFETRREMALFQKEDGTTEQREHDAQYHIPVDTLAEAHGVEFLCPLCLQKNGGRVGTHMVICWFQAKVPDHAEPGPGRWTPQGTGLDDLTFVPGEPARAVSVALKGGCAWHGFVKNGDAA